MALALAALIMARDVAYFGERTAAGRALGMWLRRQNALLRTEYFTITHTTKDAPDFRSTGRFHRPAGEVNVAAPRRYWSRRVL